MFIELPKPMQWKELNDGVNWNGLTAAEKYEVMARGLEHIREKIPEEIYPATWFDGVLLLVDGTAKVYELGAVKKLIETPDRGQNLDGSLRPCKDRRASSRTGKGVK